MKKVVFLGFLLMVLGNAQVKITDKNLNKDPQINKNVIFETESNDKAILLPRLTNKAIKEFESPKKGMLAFSLDEQTVVLYTGEKWIKLTGEEVSTLLGGGGTKPKKNFIISSYIRPNFYESRNRIDDAKMLANNDLIFFVVHPYWNGDLWYALPDNSIVQKGNVSYLPEFDGKTGVLSFNGKGSYINVGPDLLNLSGAGYKQFSFGTWIYVEHWTPNADIFAKGTKVALRMDANKSKFIFKIGNTESVIPIPEFTLNAWHHIALTYKTGVVKFFLDGQEVLGINTPTNFAKEVPFFRAPMQIGKNLNAKLDETFFNEIAAINVKGFMNRGINLRNTDWGSLKTLAYWKYDGAASFGKDEQSWRVIANEIKDKIKNSGKDIRFRLGIHQGTTNWESMMGNEANRNRFAENLKNITKNFGWDGVDFDFEWCYNNPNSQCNINYSKTIVETGRRLKELPNKTFSVSLHPVSYKISPEAIAATDFISAQIYGPNAAIMRYPKFESSAKEMVNYGIPKDKLVLGVPFYGSVRKGVPVEAYATFVDKGLITNPDVDDVSYKSENYVFNGKTTMRRKVQYIYDNEYKGLMSWDIATDTSYDNQWSLQRIVNEVLEP